MLKMGIYSLLFLNSIPDYAVCNEITELAKTLGKQGISGFINAVLNNVSRNKQLYLNKKYNAENSEIKNLSLKYSYPEWIIEKLLKTYSADFVSTILQRNEPKTHIRVNKLKISEIDFENKLTSNKITFEKSHISGGYYVNYAAISRFSNLTAFYTVQSSGSMRVCHALNVVKGESVLDVCSAPGGKSVYLHELGATVIAWDIHPHRVSLIDSYAERLGASIVTAVKDATAYDEKYKGKYDYVLCDVPCSGLGVASKKADILINRKADSLSELTTLQAKIINTASNYVKSGGYLVYSTCTMLPEENEDIVSAFLKQNSDFEAENLKNIISVNAKSDFKLKKELRGEPFIQLFPNIDGEEGFFIARLKRI